MSEDTEILIVGGGAIGVCSAYYLSAAGRDVALVDKGDICSGCSYGNGGLVVPSHSIPLSAPGVVSQSLKWMLNPESPFYIKPRLDRDFDFLVVAFSSCVQRDACCEGNACYSGDEYGECGVV